ncbi:hypothetical protein K9M47_01360 [Candidatus Gracilibacteria bacterium]|nr:hypothetical protein [Candidatus Gracilibacteria bacterium]MCF7899013.1 hypothetical protein [Candidatus Paceibacterota bacterium]
MLYVLLVIIIILLVKIAFKNRDKGAEFNKLFAPIKGVKPFRMDDKRNLTHPKEIVKYKDLSYLKREEVVREENFMNSIKLPEEK